MSKMRRLILLRFLLALYVGLLAGTLAPQSTLSAGVTFHDIGALTVRSQPMVAVADRKDDSLLTIHYTRVVDFDDRLQEPLYAFLIANLSELPADIRDFTVTMSYIDPGGRNHIVLVPTEVYESNWALPLLDQHVLRIIAQPVVNKGWQIEFLESSPIPQSPLLPLADYRFPWTGGDTWLKTQGFHYNTMGYSIDFIPDGNSSVVRSIESGVLTAICDDGYQGMLKVDHGVDESGYLHLNSSTLPRSLYNQTIARGTSLGELYNGTAKYNPPAACGDPDQYQFATPCGCGTAMHLHFEVNHIITIQGISLSTISSAPYRTPYLSTNLSGDCCGCGTATPVYNTPFLSDADLVDYTSMSGTCIRTFLSQNGSYFAQPVSDVDGVTFDMATVIAQAASAHHISPKVLLTTLQKESSAVTNPSRPSNTTMSLLMGCGSASTARAQIDCAASLFRWYQDSLISSGTTVSGWHVDLPAKLTVDGVWVTPATNAVAGQFTYTPYAGSGWGGSYGGVYLFYQLWTSFDFGVCSNLKAILSSAQSDIMNIDLHSDLPMLSSAQPEFPIAVDLEDTSPLWLEDFLPAHIITDTAIPTPITWPAAIDETGRVVGYYAYWGENPEGTGEFLLTDRSFVIPDEAYTQAGIPYYLRVAAVDDTEHISLWRTIAVWMYDPGSFQPGFTRIEAGAPNVSESMPPTMAAGAYLQRPSSTTYVVARSVLAIGGGVKSSSRYTVRSTTGQSHETGVLQSHSYQAHTGFWTVSAGAIIIPVPTDDIFLPLVLRW